MKKITFYTLVMACLLPLTSWGWGFYAHKRINRIAVFTLPPEMLGFYKSHIDYLTEHAVDADKRRHSDKAEAPRHYIDLDHYGVYPFVEVPRRWSAAVDSLTEDTLLAYGIVPWHVERLYYQLVKAFRNKNEAAILRLSADIGHYIADAHVPLHTTLNYNGQLTGQHGIHGLLESRLPELFGAAYDLVTGPAVLFENPLDRIWKSVLESSAAVDCVLYLERQTFHALPADRHYQFEQRGNRQVKAYSEAYAADYHQRLQGLVERRMQDAIRSVGAFWFSAWVAAGQPDLNQLEQLVLSPEEAAAIQDEEAIYRSQPPKGRPEAD
jgi:hypothetical protein